MRLFTWLRAPLFAYARILQMWMYVYQRVLSIHPILGYMVSVYISLSRAACVCVCESVCGAQKASSFVLWPYIYMEWKHTTHIHNTDIRGIFYVKLVALIGTVCYTFIQCNITVCSKIQRKVNGEKFSLHARDANGQSSSSSSIIGVGENM